LIWWGIALAGETRDEFLDGEQTKKEGSATSLFDMLKII
jgi:hypothetical protein